MRINEERWREFSAAWEADAEPPRPASAARPWRASDPRVEGAMNSLAPRIGRLGTLRFGARSLGELYGARTLGARPIR